MTQEWNHPVFKTREEFETRAAEVASQGEIGWWWLSFAEEKRNLGVAIVQARNVVHGALVAGYLGINPGGQVLGYQIKGDLVPSEYRERLLSREDLEQAGLA